MNTKEFTVKENIGSRLRVRSWKCSSPKDLNAIEFIRELKDKNGDVEDTSVYQFFMSDSEVAVLVNGLLK